MDHDLQLRDAGQVRVDIEHDGLARDGLHGDLCAGERWWAVVGGSLRGAMLDLAREEVGGVVGKSYLALPLRRGLEQEVVSASFAHVVLAH
eukprot:4931059-Heterocapsa_arctica.AAC.1